MSRRPTRIPRHGSSRKPTCPTTSTPENSKLKDPEERLRLARVFARGLNEPSGYVLPIQRWQAKASGHHWRSEKWKTRRGALYLVPGDSPSATACRSARCPMCRRRRFPMSSKPIRPSRAGRCRISRRNGNAPNGSPRSPRRSRARSGSSSASATSTARCAPPSRSRRGTGVLCVFLPPVERLEDYLELVAAAEDGGGASGAARCISRAIRRRSIPAST